MSRGKTNWLTLSAVLWLLPLAGQSGWAVPDAGLCQGWASLRAVARPADLWMAAGQRAGVVVQRQWRERGAAAGVTWLTTPGLQATVFRIPSGAGPQSGRSRNAAGSRAPPLSIVP